MRSRPGWSAPLMFGLVGSGALAIAGLAVVGARGVGARGGGADAAATEDYFSGTTHYAVPKSLNAGISRYDAKRNYSALTLMLFLPDFSPATAHPAEMKRVGWHDQMTLLFEHGPHMIEPDAQIAWMTNRPLGTHTRPERVANGCDLYRTPLMMPGDVYACPEDGSKLVVSCDRQSDVPSPACTVMEMIGTDLSVIYHYSAKYAGDAVAIDRHVRALIASFKPQLPTDR